jgi:hypothetical protein
MLCAAENVDIKIQGRSKCQPNRANWQVFDEFSGKKNGLSTKPFCLPKAAEGNRAQT